MNDGQHIQVFVRCRPLKSDERKSAIEILSDSTEVKVPSQSREFHFDQVFSADAPQEKVYNTVVRPLVPQVLSGYNCTVFAYGQTGTGKTYTMEGDRSNDRDSWDGTGIIPRAVSQIFDTLRQRGQEFAIRVSFLELYSEDAYDLLSPPEDTKKLRIYDDVQKKGSVKVDDLREISLESESDIFEILGRGSAKRQSAATLLNACSSRSHSIFTITVTIKINSIIDQEIIKIGKLNLVDLAGSENIARSGAQNKHAREAGNINQSLLTLTRVITGLVEKRPHIPYRESKLTRILQDSLGGATKTCMIATISPAEDDLGNTMGTLDYASRARCIINKPESNRQMTQRKTSDLEIEAFKVKLKSELEIQIRNEVALEFRRETDKIKEQFNKVLSEETRKLTSEITKLNEENASLARKMKVIQHMADDRLELVENLRRDFRRNLDEKDSRILVLQEENTKLTERVQSCRCRSSRGSENHENIHEKIHENIHENVHENLLENLESLEKTEVKKASKIRKRAPIQEDINDYANMTFDGDDEIVQCSGKKTRKRVTAGGKKRDLYQNLTLSGKKKKLRSTEEDVELSPVSPPARVTRSRATRRKLDY